MLFMILFMRVMILTVSNACEKSIAMSVVLWGGLFLLNPLIIGSIIECLSSKQCWCVRMGR